MNEQKTTAIRSLLPEPTLRRLPWYLSYVGMLENKGVGTVSSTQISKELNVDASQIAKDLSFLNIKGKTRIGYDVPTLRRSLVEFLGFECSHNAVVIGSGSLGRALMQDAGLAQYGLSIVAGFDVNPAIVGTKVCGIPIYDISELKARLEKLHVGFAILSVPVEHSQRVADLAIASGIEAIWNFTPYRIKAPQHIALANTSIYAHLAIMYNRMSHGTK